MNRFDPKLTCTYVSEWWRVPTFPTPGYLQSTRIRGLLRIDERFSQFLHGDSGDFMRFRFHQEFRGNLKICSNLEPKKTIKIEGYFLGVLEIFSLTNEPYPYSFRWGFLHFRYLKWLVMDPGWSNWKPMPFFGKEHSRLKRLNIYIYILQFLYFCIWEICRMYKSSEKDIRS